jgi:hypothetical protein
MYNIRRRSDSATRYELPPEGISLLGYVVRRMHKTELLKSATTLLAEGRPAEALMQIGLYAAAAATSFGAAYYQPAFNSPGESVSEADPATGALVTARLESRSPHFRISYSVDLGADGHLNGSETITGTTVSWRGLGMPAPAWFGFSGANGYRASLNGLVVAELLPRIFLPARIRARGELDLSDTAGNSGSLKLDRSGLARIVVIEPHGRGLTRNESLRNQLAPMSALPVASL